MCAIVEHELGPLDHVASVGCSKFAHVLRSNVVEGGKLEREGADRWDQEVGQVGRDGGEWVNSGSVSGVASTAPLLADTAQGGFSRRGARTGIHSKADLLRIIPTHSVLLALSSRPYGWPTLSIMTEGP